jgi:hypothetical protein
MFESPIAACDFEMLSLGDRARVEYNARLQAHEVTDGHVVRRSISVGCGPCGQPLQPAGGQRDEGGTPPR